MTQQKILFCKRTGYKRTDKGTQVKPFDPLLVERAMIYYGFTSRMDFALYVAKLEEHCSQRIVDDHKQRKLDKIKQLFPFYFEE